MKTTLFLFLAATVRLVAVDFGVPTIHTNANSAPFAVDSLRYQQVYDASAFSSLTPVGGGWITAIGFRGPFGIPSTAFAQISFSTTTRPVDGLSTVFAENIGSDEKVAFPRGEIVFIGVNDSPAGQFGTLSLLSTPFFYNPAAGNLLMDVRMFSGRGNFDLEASNLANDPTSRVYAFDRDALTGIADTRGLFTGFRITPIPEPSAAALAMAAIIIVSLFGIRRKQPHRKE